MGVDGRGRAEWNHIKDSPRIAAVLRGVTVSKKESACLRYTSRNRRQQAGSFWARTDKRARLGSKCQVSRGDAYRGSPTFSARGRFCILCFSLPSTRLHTRAVHTCIFLQTPARARRETAAAGSCSGPQIWHLCRKPPAQPTCCADQQRQRPNWLRVGAEESSSLGLLMSSHGVGWRSAATPLCEIRKSEEMFDFPKKRKKKTGGWQKFR